jgi:transcription initiation factor TFIIIB Brf1 subunit/transcription initiation factor TFIIB
MKLGIAMTIKPFERTERGRLLKECRAIATKLQLPPEVESKSVELLGKAVKLGVASGKKPRSVAAACVFGAARLRGERIGQTEIAGAAGITEVTIRKVWRGLEEKLGIRLPKGVAAVHENLYLTVPVHLVRGLGLKPGDRVRWSVKGTKLIGEKE